MKPKAVERRPAMIAQGVPTVYHYRVPWHVSKTCTMSLRASHVGRGGCFLLDLRMYTCFLGEHGPGIPVLGARLFYKYQ